MKIGIISDIHGNLIALETCLSFLDSTRYDKVVCLGDQFGYFPEGLACMQLIEERGTKSLLGNHEAMLIGRLPVPEEKEAVYALSGQRDEIVRTGLVHVILKRQPYAVCDYGGKTALLVHGSPWDPLQGYQYADSPVEGLDALGFDLIVMGHTHRPFVRLCNKTLVVNAGSCGLPRDRGDFASFAVYDSETDSAEIIRVPIDAGEVLIRYPDVHESVKTCLYRKNE
jgi:putative phosphoesterase